MDFTIIGDHNHHKLFRIYLMQQHMLHQIEAKHFYADFKELQH